jgi:tRNA U34 5-methylaminomethyl-2-thiouridine-forming methyltransferase MnmC
MASEDNAKDNRLEWHDDMPYSTVFGDHFYSRADGRAECNHVFLTGNDLPLRWNQPGEFTIAELGFGTGLNFLETWWQWQACKAPGSHLTFVSFEGFPMRADEMERALSAWPELSRLANKLVNAWPEEPGGVIKPDLDDTVSLEVHIGDALNTLPRWGDLADAWFLDGFAPTRNPDMWSKDLMRQVHDHTKNGGTFATYSAAGWVRRNLASAGFAVEKVPGFAGKRDMTRGVRAD